MLAEEHPDLFEKAVAYEQNHVDGRTYTWIDGETLLDLLKRKDQIIASHEREMQRQQTSVPNQPLVNALEAILDKEDESLPCLMCHL